MFQIRIQLLADLPVQVDGEPWIQPAGQVVVLRSALKVSYQDGFKQSEPQNDLTFCA